MDNLTLVIMAAGMGSRFGGLKQIEPVGPSGEIIVGYVAVRAYQQLVVGYAHRFRLRQPIVVRHRGNRPLSFQQHVFPYLF